MKRAAILTLALGLLPLTLFAQPTIAITKGRVFTGDPANPTAEAIAITGNKITAVGTNAQIQALVGPKTNVIEVDGRLVIPGINDAHTHLGFAPAQTFTLNTEPDATFAQVSAAIAGAIAETPADFWIFASVGPPIINDPSITREDLDQASGGRKVFLQAFTGHGAVVSTAGLTDLGVPLNAPDPNGGRFERDALGKINGRVFEYAHYPLMAKLAGTASQAEIADSLVNFSAEAVRLGITSVQTMPLVDETRFIQALGLSNIPLRVRVISMPFVQPPTAAGPGVKALKWILDGTPLEKGAAVRTPYPGGGTGRINFPNLAPLVKDSLTRHHQALFHAVGDATIEALFKAMENERRDWTGIRPRVEHGDGLLPDLFTRAKKLGVIVVQNPTHFSAGPLFPSTGGYQRMKSLLDAGIPVALGSDGPSNPFLNMHLAVSRPDNPTEAITVEQALTAYTATSAFAELQDKVKGKIAPNMLADIAVLSRNILARAIDPFDTRSVLTIIDGKVVHTELP